MLSRPLGPGGGGEPAWLLSSPFNEAAIALSPDGRWLAYVSTVSGQPEVFVRPFPEGGGRVQVSTDGGNEPVWAHSGEELFYRDGESWMSVASVETDRGIRITSRERLFNADPYRASGAYRHYDVSSDDQRFIMVRFGAGGGSSELILVENWFQELREAVEGG